MKLVRERTRAGASLTSVLFYFDHNATTPVAPEVTETVLAALREVSGNPSSTHSAGQLARHWLERSRRTLAEFLDASAAEIVFTSGGTEANNLAVLGLTRNLPQRTKHVITTAVEHPAVLEPCRQLEREGIEVTYVPVDCEGRVDPHEISRRLRADTVLISVMHANSEVGTIEPIEEIAALVRKRRESGQEIYLHSDGVQALGKIEVGVQALGVDLYSISAHKIFAPKGFGALYVRKGVPLRATQFGGRHERERRAGTENVPGAMAFARAAELCRDSRDINVQSLRDRFEERVLAAEPETKVNGSVATRLPNTSNLTFENISGEAMVIALDMLGMQVSTGSACSSGSVEPSHVLLAMGRSRDTARSSVRYSFGRYNTADDVNALADAVVATVRRLRRPGSNRREVKVGNLVQA